MKNELSYKTAVCPEYELLLKACQASLEIWERRRREICESHSAGKETGAQLLRLQSDFAKLYSALRRHVDECELCQFVSKLGRRQPKSDSAAVGHAKAPM